MKPPRLRSLLIATDRSVEAGTAARGRVDDLGLQSRHHAQRLSIALEAADALADPIEFALAVVSEGRVPEVVGQARDIDQVRVAPEGGAHLAGDLGHLKRVREPGAREVCAARHKDLGSRRESPEPSGVQDPGAITCEG